LTDVTVVADAGMISETNQIAIQAAGLSYILGTRIPFLPDVVQEWRDKHSGEELPDGHVHTQPWPATSIEKARGIPDRVIYYQYRTRSRQHELSTVYDENLAAHIAGCVAGEKEQRANEVLGLARSLDAQMRVVGLRPGRRHDLLKRGFCRDAAGRYSIDPDSQVGKRLCQHLCKCVYACL
jgi:hypothetical protein